MTKNLTENRIDLHSINTSVGNIRKKRSFNALLRSLVAETMSLLRGSGGIVVFVDKNKKVTDYRLEGHKFKLEFKTYSTHPIDKIPSLCTLLNKKSKVFISSGEGVGLYEKFFLPKPKSVVAVPIYDMDMEVIGTISVTSDKEINFFCQQDAEILTNISEQTSSAIDKVIQLENLSRIQGIADLLLSDFNYDLLAQKLASLYDAYGCSIFLRKNVNGEDLFVLKGTTGLNLYGRSLDYDEIYYRTGEGLTGYVAEEGVLLKIYDTSNKEEILTKAPGLIRISPKYREHLDVNQRKDETHSYIGVPILLHGEVIGVFRLTKKDYFLQHDENTLKIISNYISSRIKLKEESIAEFESVKEINYYRNHITDFTHDATRVLISLSQDLETITEYFTEQSKKNNTRKEFENNIKKKKETLQMYINEIENIIGERQKTVVETTNLKSHIDKIKELFDYRLKKTKIKYNNKVNKKILLEIDKFDLRRVLINLTINSIRAIRNSGIGANIWVKAREYERDSTKYVMILFSDDGPGIRNDLRDKIFIRGFSGYQEGTGIGLDIVKKTLKYYNGNIVPYPRDITRNKGAMFIISIPETYSK